MVDSTAVERFAGELEQSRISAWKLEQRILDARAEAALRGTLVYKLKRLVRAVNLALYRANQAAE